jgi:hypothetical protein
MPQIFPDPPSSFTGPALTYLRLVSAALRNLPHWSYASLATPNSVVTGKLGDRFFNLGSQSTLSREWIKVGPDDGVTASTTSWAVVRIL